MSDPPNIPSAFLYGGIFFSSTAFVCAGTYALYHGQLKPFRYSFFTAVNVGVAGGMFIGIRACLLHIPVKLQSRSLQDKDYLFASGISAGLIGGTFNLINSSRTSPARLTTGGPQMAIPGAVLFTVVGVTGQLISNAMDRWRIRYILANEERWNEEANAREEKKPKSGQWEENFEFLENIGVLKKADPEKRIRLLRGEITKLDGMLKKVDDEIAKLEKEKEDTKGK